MEEQNYENVENECNEEESNRDEVYCVTLNSNKIFYGGRYHSCTLYNTTSEVPEAQFEDFSDSVIFCKSIGENLFLVCTIDGTIVLLSREDVINSEKIEEDITFVDLIGDRLMIGGSQGTIYVYSADLTQHNVYLGHGSDIQNISYSNNTIYSLSDSQFIAFNETTFQQRYKKNLKGATVFEGIPNTEIFCIGKEGEVIILKNGFLMHKWEVDGTPECIILNQDHFIVGGSFPFVLLINTKMNMREYKIRLEIEGCTKIQAIDENKIALSTICGLVGTGDIRRDDSFEFKDSLVGTVFDFVFLNGKFYVGGQEGFEVVE